MLKLFIVRNHLERRMKRVFVIIPVLAVLILSITFLAGWHLTNAQTKVTKEEILKLLSSTELSKTESSQALIKRIKDRGGVDFPPTTDILELLRTNGATEDLIKAIEENSPKLTPPPTPERQIATPTPTPISAPRSGEESLSVDQIISVLNNPKESITGRNIFLAKIIKRRGVDFDS